MEHDWYSYLAEPIDPLIFRDGRPFDNTPGARARTLAFPMPSTLVGALRSIIWEARGPLRSTSVNELNKERDKRSQELQNNIELIGPLLVELDDDGNILNWFGPYPADALALKRKDAEGAPPTIRRLVPLEVEGGQTDLDGSLHVVGLARADTKSKPAETARYWYWDALAQWLTEGAVHSRSLGHSGPVTEVRTHVSIDPKLQSAQEGLLFQTSGLEFTYAPQGLAHARRLALLTHTTAELNSNNLSPLGGERRKAVWLTSAWTPPGIPARLLEQIKRHKACRVMLLTPGLFEGGYKPSTAGPLVQAVGTVQPNIAAVAIHRHQVISGFDFRLGKPKPTRRVAPAGTVFFLKLGDDAADEDLSAWAERIWFHNISDAAQDAQDQRDGFGLAVLGSWSGEYEELEVA